MTGSTSAMRQPMLLQLDGGKARSVARAQNFTVERLAGQASDRTFNFAAQSEIMLLLPDNGATLAKACRTELPGHAIAILPGGAYSLDLEPGHEAYVLSTDRCDAAGIGTAVNEAAYSTIDPRVRPVHAFKRITYLAQPRVYRIADIAIPPDNGRLRFLQSETMSLNWVEYEGRRGRNALSPHAHDDLEQATLAIHGRYVHHLRTPWGRDADAWREDQHLGAGPGSILVIPPAIIHTSEGVSNARHVLVDIFAPPRSDFLARGWVHNAGEYRAPD